MGGQCLVIVLEKRSNKIKVWVYKIWPFNLIAMVKKFGPSEVFNITEEEKTNNAY
jgi:hypothetical protein